MKTTLKIQLLDSSEDGCICFGDIMTIPCNTPEELFTSIYGTDDIGIPASDIRTGRDENNNPQIEINLFLDKHYFKLWHNGLVTYNKITGFLGNTETNLTSTQSNNDEQEITNEEAESIMNGEMINAGTNTPMQRVFEKDIYEYFLDEKKWLQHELKMNNDARKVFCDIHDLIIHLKDMDTYYYIYHMLVDERIQIENSLNEKFNTYK